MKKSVIIPAILPAVRVFAKMLAKKGFRGLLIGAGLFTALINARMEVARLNVLKRVVKTAGETNRML